MKERLMLFISVALMLALFGLMSSASALTEKEQMEKENGDLYQLQPIDLPVIMEHGGPDAGGYYYIDSYDSALNAPVFNWIDISGSGVDMGITSDDQNAGPFPIGFTFNFYGSDFTTFRACSNGFASFTSTSTDFSNDPIPTATEPNNLLAVFWDDLHPRTGGHAYYYSNNVDTLVIAWHNFERYSGAGVYTFEIILTADNKVVYQYQSMTGTLDSHTIGIENAGGTIGTQYRYNQPGLTDGTAVYFGTEPPIFGDPGYLMGTVTDLQMNPIDGAEVAVGYQTYTTGPDGGYYFELQPLTYSATASAMYHNPVTVDDISITEHETTTVDFALPTPLINVNTSVINLEVDSGEVATAMRNVANVGDGELAFNVEVSIGPITARIRRPEMGVKSMSEKLLRTREQLMDTKNEYSPTYTVGQLPTILDFGDEVFMFDPEGPTGDIRCLGVEFDGTYFWVTGAGDGSGSQNRIHKFDSEGNYITSYMQNTSSAWGWRDLAWDGEYLYASDDTQIDIFDPVAGQVVGSFNGPENPNRAMAYDPATDHFWTANFSSSIFEFDRNGAVVHTYANPQALSIYGMAWDDASDDGPWLWIFSQDGSPMLQFSQFDPFSGTFTGTVFYGIDNGSGGIAGGAAFTTEWDPTLGVIFGLHQGTPDIVKGYEITPYSQWLSVDPMSGVLQPSENVDLEVTIDFSVPGINYDSTYEAILYVNNNTPEIPEIPIVINGIVGTEDQVEGLPHAFALAQNFPNPFNAQTKINFALPQQSDVTIEIFNLLGQKTATLAEGLFPAGSHTVTWDASDVASGVYYYKLTAGDYSAIKMMTLLK